MHGELLELNENLIKQNRKKNFVNERLKKELIALRGPVRKVFLQIFTFFNRSERLPSPILSFDGLN